MKLDLLIINKTAIDDLVAWGIAKYPKMEWRIATTLMQGGKAEIFMLWALYMSRWPDEYAEDEKKDHGQEVKITVDHDDPWKTTQEFGKQLTKH
jgi:hypothetical protein